MPARARRVYVVHQNAMEVGLAFAMPFWWDVERLFEMNANRRTARPDNREVLLLDWTAILGFDLKEGRKTWKVPEKKVEGREIQEQREVLLEAVQEAEWFIIERERVWVVSEQVRPGCDVWEGPPWWNFFFGDSDFRAWYQAFRETHRLDDRRFAVSNPFRMDDVSLLTGPEAVFLDERCRESYRAFTKSIGQKRLTAYIRREMARFARSLRQAEWVVLYDYEWESGLA